MKPSYIFLYFFLMLLLPATALLAQAPPILWQKTIGGDDTDILSGMYALSGGSLALSGYSRSGISGDKKDSSRGSYDFWVMKLNSDGSLNWEKTFGGSYNDTASRIIKTTDNGFLVAGTSLSEHSGDKSNPNYGNSPDYWVLKLDKNGEQLWQETLGGYFTEKLTYLTENSYGYVIGGHSYSDVGGNKESDNSGSENRADYWSVSIDKTGKLKHTYTYGTVGPELSCCAVATNYGNIIGGSSYSLAQQGFKTSDSYGGSDYWIVRTDLSGTKIYDSTIGGNSFDFMTCMTGTHDGGYVAGGYSSSPVSGSKTDSNRGVYDYWLLKMDINGNVKWQKTLGGSLGDYMTSVEQTHDGGYIVGGYSASNAGGEKSEDSKGGIDYWIVKLDSLGNKQWDKTYGGSGDDKLVGVAEYDTGQYVLCGTSTSPASGDKTDGTMGGTGKADFWIVRLGKAVDSIPTDPGGPIDTPVVKGNYSLTIAPNPTAKDKLVVKFSSTDNEMTNFILRTYDGKKVLSFSLMATKEVQILPAPNPAAYAKLPRGVYYLTMYTSQQKVTKMVIKP